MARKKKKEKAEQETESKTSKFQWLLFAIVIPLLFAVTVSLIVMTVAGVNIFDKAKELGGSVPGVSSMIDSESSKDSKVAKSRLVSLQAEVEEQKAEIEKLQKKLDASDKEIEKLLTEKDRLEVELEQQQKQQEGSRDGQPGDKSKSNDKDGNPLIDTYESMAPKNVANIIVNLSDAEAVNIISAMSTDKQAKILEKLPPEKAAKYTKMLAQ
ncbi:MotE family protein [Bacillus sp. REN10]|uniref:MotE family protein n=1 Tax=Bacillus sp. REN10 TaxID=2782541 RepID=UPI00193B06C2|nr:MotE family protein [Bacillus sp. REN10]